jgi:hypothetical protein
MLATWISILKYLSGPSKLAGIGFRPVTGCAGLDVAVRTGVGTRGRRRCGRVGAGSAGCGIRRPDRLRATCVLSDRTHNVWFSSRPKSRGASHGPYVCRGSRHGRLITGLQRSEAASAQVRASAGADHPACRGPTQSRLIPMSGVI